MPENLKPYAGFEPVGALMLLHVPLTLRVEDSIVVLNTSSTTLHAVITAAVLPIVKR